MAKKFRDDMSQGEMQPIRNISLSEYVSLHAPDILGGLAQMRGEPALDFYKRIFEPSKPTEEKEILNNGVTRWPYAQRFINLARKFILLEANGRNTVIEAAEQKIYWRGDDLKFFGTVVKETIMFRQLEPNERCKYKKRIWQVAKSLTTRHAAI